MLRRLGLEAQAGWAAAKESSYPREWNEPFNNFSSLLAADHSGAALLVQPQLKQTFKPATKPYLIEKALDIVSLF